MLSGVKTVEEESATWRRAALRCPNSGNCGAREGGKLQGRGGQGDVDDLVEKTTGVRGICTMSVNNHDRCNGLQLAALALPAQGASSKLSETRAT